MGGRSALTSGISDALGWSYFFAWSLSFYPQVFDNRRRQSVVGMSFEYQLFNLLGYSCYSIYTGCLCFNKQVKRQYDDVFEANLVTTQDFCFAVHGLLLTVVTTAQCFVYNRGSQRLSSLAVLLVGAAGGVTLAFALAVVFNEDDGDGSSPRLVPGLHLLSWLAWVYWLSLVKVVIRQRLPSLIIAAPRPASLRLPLRALRLSRRLSRPRLLSPLACATASWA